MRCPSLDQLPPPPTHRKGWPWTEGSKSLPDRMPDGSEWPRISIVTPNYNYGHYLEATIRSVLLQGYPNIEGLRGIEWVSLGSEGPRKLCIS